MYYYSLNNFLKNKFNTKIVKLSVDGGFTCPNRDGTLSFTGCVFCSEKGSGDFSGNREVSITNQLESQKALLAKKWSNCKYIAYFQAFTNTYADVEVLRARYEEALSFPDVCGIAIATRPDCLNDAVLKLLADISKKTYVWVELGLQTSNEGTALLINRGYKNKVFEDAVYKLNKLNIDVVVHTILGLPTETEEDIIETVKYITSFNIQGIKLQLLHILKNTPLEKIYYDTNFHILEMEEYIGLVCKLVSIIPQNIVIHRLTGDGPKKDLIAPLWSGNKKAVLNGINKKIAENSTFF